MNTYVTSVCLSQLIATVSDVLVSGVKKKKTKVIQESFRPPLSSPDTSSSPWWLCHPTASLSPKEMLWYRSATCHWFSHHVSWQDFGANPIIWYSEGGYIWVTWPDTDGGLVLRLPSPHHLVQKLNVRYMSFLESYQVFFFDRDFSGKVGWPYVGKKIGLLSLQLPYFSVRKYACSSKTNKTKL